MDEALTRLTDCLARVDRVAVEGAHAEVASRVAQAQQAFAEAMLNDLNTAAALGAMFELVRALNSAIDTGQLGQRLLEMAVLEGGGGLVRDRFEHPQLIRVVLVAVAHPVGHENRPEEARLACQWADHREPEQAFARRRQVGTWDVDVRGWVRSQALQTRLPLGRGNHDLERI